MITPRYKRPEIEWKHFAVGDATCDKELSGLLHIRELMRAISAVSPAAGERVRQFTEDMQKIIDQKITGG